MDDSECIIWDGPIILRSGKQYGLLRRRKKRFMAHRQAWEGRNGPIPSRQCLFNTCGNTLCINVAHWTLVQDRQVERFMRFVQKDEGTKCWNWTGDTKLAGYGNHIIQVGGTRKTVISHRWAYEYFIGPIPHGHHVHHKCQNRSCCNPEHLEAILPVEHTRKTPASVSARHSVKTHCPSGHEYNEKNIYMHAGSRHCKTCMNNRVKERRKAG